MPVTVTVNIDMTPPAIAVSAPADMTTLSQSPVTVTGSASDALSGTSQVTCGGTAATLADSAFSCSVSLNVGLDLIVIKATDEAGNVSAAKLHLDLTGTLPAPNTLTVTPTGVNMLVGGTQQFNANDELGRVRTDATWTVSDTTVATITTDSSPLMTAVAAGQVTLTASVGSVTGQTTVNILSGTSLPDGTLLWSAPPPAGFTAQQIVQAQATWSTPDFYTIARGDSQNWLITGVTMQGQAMWTSTWTAATPFNLLQAAPDQSGGLLLSTWDANGYNGSGTNHIVDFDGPTGTEVWRTDFYGGGDEPQLTIGQDGTVYYTGHLDTNTYGVVLLAADTGIAKLLYSPPEGVETITSCNGQTSYYGEGGALPTNPVVGADGTVMVAYGVANYSEVADSNCNWTYSYNHTLYLKQIGPGGSATPIPFETETTFPVRSWPDLQITGLIPDGQGGALVAWSQNTATNGVYNLHVSHVTSNGVADYSTTGANGFSEMVLGDNGTAFANTGSAVTALNLTNMAPLWTCQAPVCPNSMGIIASSAGGGLVVKTTSSSGVDTVVRLDPSGNPTTDDWSGNQVNYYVDNLFTDITPAGDFNAYSAIPVVFADSVWIETQQAGTNTSPGYIYVYPQSSSDAGQSTIVAVFNSLQTALTAEAASSSHPCSDWFQTSPLTPSGDTAVSAINKLLTNNSTTDPINRFGHGTFNYVDSSGNITGVDTMTGAVFGQRNVGEGAPTIKVPSNWDITVNDLGDFFNGTSNGQAMVTTPERYPGGTIAAQAVILLHEVGHNLLLPPPFQQNDGANLTLSRGNDTQVYNHCQHLVEDLAGVSASSIAFGNQSVTSTSAAQSITLTATWNYSMTVGPINITGPNAAEFYPTTTCGTTMKAYSQCQISVTFTPQALGPRSAVLNINDSAMNTPETVQLTGTGTGN